MEGFGVNVLIENNCHSNFCDKFYFYTGEEMVVFLKYANYPLINAAWDVCHALVEVEQYSKIMALGDELHALHIHDNGGMVDEHAFLFTGV